MPGDADERAYFTDHYRSMWFFDAKVWLEAELNIIELATVHRQRDDAFAAMLTAVRHGRVTADMAGQLNEAGQARPGRRHHPRDPQRHGRPDQQGGPRTAARQGEDRQGRRQR